MTKANRQQNVILNPSRLKRKLFYYLIAMGEDAVQNVKQN